MPTDPPATLAAWLRTRSDEQLSGLLAARPDVSRPAPSDVVALASRLPVPLWGDDVLRAPDPVRRAVRHPAGLGRRAAELRLQLPADLPQVLDELDAEERGVLERLAGERPVG